MRDYKLGETQIDAHGRPVFREIVQAANGSEQVVLVVRDDIAVSIASALRNAYHNGRKDQADESAASCEKRQD